jgi:hypothetical protein
VDEVVSGYGPVAGSCEYSDEPLGSGVTELVNYSSVALAFHLQYS